MGASGIISGLGILSVAASAVSGVANSINGNGKKKGGNKLPAPPAPSVDPDEIRRGVLRRKGMSATNVTGGIESSSEPVAKQYLGGSW